MTETSWSPSSSFWDSPAPVPLKNLPELLEDHWIGSAPTSKSSGSSSIFKFLSITSSKSSATISSSSPNSLGFRGVLCRPASQVSDEKIVPAASSPAAPATPLVAGSPAVSMDLGVGTRPVDIPTKSGVANAPPQGLLSKNLQAPACRSPPATAEGAIDGALGSWATRKAVYPVVSKVKKSGTIEASEPSPDSTLDRSDSRSTSGGLLEVFSPDVLGGEFIPAKKPKQTFADTNLGNAAWRYRFRRKWAREQLKYYRGRMSPTTPPKPLEGKPDEVASALVGWMEDVHAFSPSALPDLATQQDGDARQFLPMGMMAY